MTAMNTDQLLQVALDLAATTAAISCDSAVLNVGTRISHVLLTAHVDIGTLFMARQLGYHAVIGYFQPTGSVTQQWQAFHHLQSSWMVRQGIGNAAQQHYIDNNAASLQLIMQQHEHSSLATLARQLDMPLILMHAPIAALAQQRILATLAPAITDSTATSASLLSLLNQPEINFDAQTITLGNDTRASGRIAIDVGWRGMLAADAVRIYNAEGFVTIITGTIETTTAVALLHENANRTIIALGQSNIATMGVLPYVEALRKANIEVTLL